MNKILNIILLSIIFIAISCVDDKTVTDFVELNDVEILGVNDAGYDILLDEEFVLDPELETVKNDESDLEFLWYYYQKFGDYKSDTISHEKVLKHTFKGLNIGGAYSLTLKVRDKTSNVFYQKTVKINPINKYSSGTLLLCKENDETKLNLLMHTKNIFLENIFVRENDGEKLDPNPTKVFFISPYDRNIAAFKAILVLNNTNGGGHYLNPANMKKQNTMRRKLNGEIPDPVLNISHYCSSQTNDFIISNNKIRTRQGTMDPEANWSEILKINAEVSDYSLDPVSLHPGYAQPLLYDKLNGRFLSLNDEGVFSFFAGDNHQMTAFDANNLGEGMTMLSAGYFEDKNSMWALMKDASKYYILRFSINNGVFNAQAKVEVTSQMASNLSGATKFASLTKVFAMNKAPWTIRVDGIDGRMAYLSNNNIYVLNMNVNANNVAENLLIEGVKEDVEITNVLARTIQPSATNSEAYVRIDLCVKDNSLTSKKGGVAFYKLNTLGGLFAQKIYKKTGFCDEVVYLDEKLN